MSDNQNIRPSSAVINEKGHLEIGGCDCVDLAEQYGTPLYVYDEQTIRNICGSYKKSFEKYPNINMMFAAKSFMTKAICKIMQSENFGLDCVSGGEIYTAYKSGFDMSKVLFNGSNKSVEEIEMAIDLGVGRFSVDNFLELALVNTIANAKNKVQDILLRITPGIECHTHEYIQTGHLDSKFGFDLTQLDSAIELIKDEYTNLKLRGLHAHIGSQIFETQVYHDEIEVLLKQILEIENKHGLKLDEMNIGGGLGITYTDEDTPPSIEKFAEVVIGSIEENTQKYNMEKPQIYIEPGRSIVGTAGVSLYTIGSSKQVPNGRKYVAVDGGMADNVRPAMYDAKYSAVIANKADEKEEEIVTISGRYCESGDILIKDISLPKTESGDIICLFNTGAYGYSMSSNYNRTLKPAIVLVNRKQSDIIVRRESYDELISHDELPARL